MFDRIWPRVRLRAERSDVAPVSAPPGLLRLVRRSCQKKEHNLATMRRGYPAFFVQGGSAAGRWETRNDGKVSHCERSEEISIRIKALRINRAIRDLVG